MQSAKAFRAWWPVEKLSVHGYVDALKNYRELSGIRRSLLDRLLKDPARRLYRCRCAGFQPVAREAA